LTTGVNETITLPLDTTLAYNFQINWGDEGSARNIQVYNATNPSVSHTYATTGTHQIQISATTFPRLYCNNTAVCKKLLSVDQWGDIKWTSMVSAFNGASNLAILAEDTPDLTLVKDMTSMFNGATNLTGNFSGWDTSKVTNMTTLFYNASGFDQDLSSWGVTGIVAVANMTNMLNGTHLSLYNYNALLDSRSHQTPLVAVSPFALPNTKYGGCEINAQAGIEGHQKLIQPLADGGKVWVITDGGLEFCHDGAYEMEPFQTTRILPSTLKLTIPTL
jgi:surface protein